MTPFIIYALPRSRTAWLSRFLSYGDWTCYHEQLTFMRSLEEMQRFFARPNMGSAETAGIQGRHLIRYVAPDIREIVILRPVDEVVNSILSINIGMAGTYNVPLLQRNMEYGDRELRKLSKKHGVLVLNYEDLELEENCKRIFEYCLPYRFDKVWWEFFKSQNIQVSLKEAVLYYLNNRDAIENFKRHCKSELIRLRRSGEIKGISKCQVEQRQY